MSSFYAIFVLLSLGFRLGASSFQTEVRILSNQEIPADADPCILLTSRAQEQWDSGMLSNCQFVDMIGHPNNDTELVFNVEVNDEKLEEGLADPSLYDFQMWSLNQIINGNDSESCSTITGVGHWNDSYTSSVAKTDYIPREQLIVVAPFDEHNCDQFMKQPSAENELYVIACELVVTSEAPVNGVYLAKYRLYTLDPRGQLDSSNFYENHIIFLRHLTNFTGQCSINGYWAKGHIVMLNEVRFFPDEKLLEAENRCSVLQDRAPEHWENKLIVGCTFNEDLNGNSKNSSELIFLIQVNTTRMPEDYKFGLSEQYYSWYINYLINGLDKKCQTTTGGTSFMEFMSAPFQMHGFSAKIAINLVGPYDVDFCKKVIGDKTLAINKCYATHILKKPLGGFQLARYRLITINRQDQLVKSLRLALDKLNGDTPGCRYNGIWSNFMVNYMD